MAKFATNASGVLMLLNLIQVTESISGSVVQCVFSEFSDMEVDALQKCKSPVCRDGAMGRLVKGLIFGVDGRILREAESRKCCQNIAAKCSPQIQSTSKYNTRHSGNVGIF